MVGWSDALPMMMPTRGPLSLGKNPPNDQEVSSKEKGASKISPFYSLLLTPYSCSSVSKVPHLRKHHGHPVLVRRRDDLGVADGAAGLDHSPDAGRGRRVQPVAEREKSVRGQDRALGFVPGLPRRQTDRIDAVHLARAHADRGRVVGE